MPGLGLRVCSLRSRHVFSFVAYLAIVIVVLIAPPAYARKGVLWVKVVDTKTQRPVEGVEISIKGTATKAISDKNGEIGFELEEGKYNVSLLKTGYYNSVQANVEVVAGKQSRIDCELVAGDSSQQLYFGIGGVNVVGKRDLLPTQLETTHEITSAEIEHNLSTNLGDVLMLVPGVEKTTPPGLSKQSEVEFRGTGFVGESAEKSAALFGTKVMVDGVRISNNANLQSGYTATSTTSSSAGIGIDLRTIPADNIDKVEVVTGVPSVEYGDMTTGLVKVETKKEKQPHRLKLKSNPDTKEGNLSGGWEPKDIGLSYNLNYAWSERDIRREGDEYSRYSGQITVRNHLLQERASLLNKVFYTGVIDEMDLNPADPLAMKQSNKDKTYLYGLTFDFKKSDVTKFSAAGSVQYTNRDSYYQRLVGADTRVLTGSLEEGTREGILSSGAYVGKVWTKGEEWTIDGRANARRDFDLWGQGHSVLGGADYTFDDNVGQGEIFNPLEPPGGALGKRPLPFDASPALYTASLYLEDEVNGIFYKRPWTANLGVRYEAYRPDGIDFGKIFSEGAFIQSKNGSFLNPRLRVRYDLFKDTRIRLGWGKSSKMPSMTTIYQGPEYVDVVEENVTPPDSVPLITTYIYQFDNEHLPGYQNEKTEVSLDQKVGSVAAVLTGFFTKTDDIPHGRYNPITVYRYRWNDWPAADSRSVIDSIYTRSDEQTYSNRGWMENWGVEAQVNTARIRALSTIFKISASFVHDRWGANGSQMSTTPRPVEALGGRTVYPYYSYPTGWSRKLIINYSADWLFEKVGLWTTFFVQQTLFDADLNNDDPNVYATSYYDPVTGEMVYLSSAGSDSLGLTRTIDPLDVTVFEKPNDRWLFNINVTKSLGRGAEVSLFVYNVFDDAADYLDAYGYFKSRNHDIFYGVELSMVLDEFFKKREPKGQ